MSPKNASKLNGKLGGRPSRQEGHIREAWKRGIEGAAAASDFFAAQKIVRLTDEHPVKRLLLRLLAGGKPLKLEEFYVSLCIAVGPTSKMTELAPLFIPLVEEFASRTSFHDGTFDPARANVLGQNRLALQKTYFKSFTNADGCDIVSVYLPDDHGNVDHDSHDNTVDVQIDRRNVELGFFLFAHDFALQQAGRPAWLQLALLNPKTRAESGYFRGDDVPEKMMYPTVWQRVLGQPIPQVIWAA